MRKHEREMRKQIEALGIPADSLELKNSGHYSLLVQAGNAQRKFSFAASPSDKRATMNMVADIRRWLRSQQMNS